MWQEERLRNPRLYRVSANAAVLERRPGHCSLLVRWRDLGGKCDGRCLSCTTAVYVKVSKGEKGGGGEYKV